MSYRQCSQIGRCRVPSKVKRYFKKAANKLRRQRERRDPENAPKKTAYFYWVD